MDEAGLCKPSFSQPSLCVFCCVMRHACPMELSDIGTHPLPNTLTALMGSWMTAAARTSGADLFRDHTGKVIAQRLFLCHKAHDENHRTHGEVLAIGRDHRICQRAQALEELLFGRVLLVHHRLLPRARWLVAHSFRTFRISETKQRIQPMQKEMAPGVRRPPLGQRHHANRLSAHLAAEATVKQPLIPSRSATESALRGP